MTAIKTCLLLFCAGGLGALSRYGVTQLMTALCGKSFPAGTFVANLIGCFLFGLVWEIAAVRGIISDATRVILCVGYLGSLTTFSSLVFDSFSLGQTRPFLLVLNLALQLVFGFAALWAGIQAGARIPG